MKNLLDQPGSIFGSRAGEAGMVGTIAQWCESLQGHAPLIGALGEITRGIGAEAANLARVRRGPGAHAKSLIFDNLPDKSPLPALERSFALSVLGSYFSQVRTGSIWFRSVVEIEEDPALTDFQSRRRLSELAVVPLEVSEKSIDFIELHFADRLDPDRYALLNVIVATLTRTWSNRKNGLLTKSTMQAQRRDFGAASMPAILGFENPAKLSRAEFRVCLMLSQGLSNARICEEPEITLSTIRTHLRSIYAKTQTTSRSELLYHLLTPGVAPVLQHNARVA